MKILILGYYNKQNLGDDMLAEVLPQLLSEHKVTVISSDTDKIPDGYDIIMLGGGNVILDYFIEKFNRLISKVSPAIYVLIGAGVSYISYLKKHSIENFDYVFTRTWSAFDILSTCYTARAVHFLPDLGFYLTSQPRTLPICEEKNPRRVGIFPVGNKMLGSKIFHYFCLVIKRLLKNSEVILYPFNTSSERDNTDLEFCEDIQTVFSNVKIKTIVSTQEMLKEISGLDLAFCGRFHAHVFCIIQQIPFVSIKETSKVQDLLDQLQYEYQVPLEKGKAEDYLEMADKAWGNRQLVRERLNYYYKQSFQILRSDKLNKFFASCSKKRISFRDQVLRPIGKVIHRVDEFLIKMGKPSTAEIIKGAAISFSPKEAEKMGKYLCFQITRLPGSSYEYGTIENLKTRPSEILGMCSWIHSDFTQSFISKHNQLIDLSFVRQDSFSGLHRSGWEYVLAGMYRFSDGLKTVLCDTYCDRTFHWAQESLTEEGILPYTSKWFGFIHHCPEEKYTGYNTVAMMKNPYFLMSLKTCCGLVFLSRYLKDWFSRELKKMGYNIPLYVLFHPTLIVPQRFTLTSPDLVHVGAWYRNPWSIYLVETKRKKFALKGKKMENYFPPDKFILESKELGVTNPGNKFLYYFIQWLRDSNFLKGEWKLVLNGQKVSVEGKEAKEKEKELQTMLSSVQVLEHLSDEKFDLLLSSNVVFLDLVDASACNTVIESIVRETPIIVRRHPAVVEYLGDDYPLLYDDLKEVGRLSEDGMIQRAHEYLKKKDKTFLTLDYFLEEFAKLPFNKISPGTQEFLHS